MLTCSKNPGVSEVLNNLDTSISLLFWSLWFFFSSYDGNQNLVRSFSGFEPQPTVQKPFFMAFFYFWIFIFWKEFIQNYDMAVLEMFACFCIK